MKRGPKPKPRTTQKAPIEASNSPVMPDYLAEEDCMHPARTVWLENIERVLENGCHDGDSDFFARYCIQEAGYREHVKLWFEGHPNFGAPKTSAVESLRKMSELLGIAGPSSRARFKGLPASADNSFRNNGKVPRQISRS